MASVTYPNLLPEPIAAAGDHAAPQGLHLGRVVRRRLAVGTLIFLLLAPTFVALAVLKYQPYFVAEAIVQVNSIRPRILYRTDDNSSNTGFSTFFNTQIATLKSTALLNRCLTDPAISSSHILEGAQDPLQSLRAALEVDTIPGTQYLSVKARDETPQGLAQVVNTVVRAYMSYLDEADSISQNRKIQLLDAERRKLALDVETKTAALLQLRASMASDPDASSGLLIRDPLSVTHEALVGLRTNGASLKTKIEALQAALKSPDIQVPASVVDAALARDPELEPLVIMLAQLRREIVLAESEAASPSVANVQARLNADPQVGALKQDAARRELQLARLAQGAQTTPGEAKDDQGVGDAGILIEALSDVPEARWLAATAMDLRRELAMLDARGTTPTAAMVRERLDAEPRIRALKDGITRMEVGLAQMSETLREQHHTIWQTKATLKGMQTGLAEAETELEGKVTEELKQNLQQREKDLRAQLHSVEEQLKPHCERAFARTKAIIEALRSRLAEVEPELKVKLVQDIRKDAGQRATDLKTQLASVEKQVNDRREQARGKVIARLKEEAQSNMTRQLRDLEGELAAASTSEKALRTMLTEQVGRRATGERKLAELKGLEDDLGRARQSLLGVEQRLHELEVEAGAPGFVTIASMATDPKLPEPYAGRRIKYGIVGVIGAAGLALLVMILLDRKDDRIRSPEDLKLVGGAELLGCVPHWGGHARLAASEPALLLNPAANAPVLVAEEIRNLMVSILSPADGRPVRTVLVTGAAPGDGKTTVAVNLAGCMAGLGKSVLLIDANFRKPDIARLFAVDNLPGLGDVLANRADLSAVTRATSVPGLRVVPAGSAPPDTVGVLGSAGMRAVLKAFASHYDHVLLDGPPVMLADARILASLVDGVVCSLSAFTSRRGAVQECLTTLRRLGTRILGVVLVGVKPEHNGYAAMSAALRGYARSQQAVPQLAVGEPEAQVDASDMSPAEN